jgi:predicted DNA-binding transcriptional regulator AlpA
MKQLPEVGYLRLPQIVGDVQRNIPAIIPVGKSTWWAGVKTGRFPKAFKLGPRTTVWRVADVMRLFSETSEVAHA